VTGIDFVYGRCPMKHYVRTHAWLPLCQKRLKAIRGGRPERYARRLRYFTFCATEAVDVLMLDIARVVKRSATRKFDTVHFFGRKDEAIADTARNIPGARGFAGDFVEVVMTHDAGENIATGLGALESPPDLADTTATREPMRRLQTRRDFRGAFPFDVINLDLEDYLFKPTDTVPGDLLRALRRVFEWQQHPLVIPKRPDEHLDAFGLMFTTRLGPRELSPEFIRMLRDSLDRNLNADGQLRPLLATRTGIEQVVALLSANFEAFFKLSAPKVIAELLMETDWYIDPENGIDVYEFERKPPVKEAYKMLHIVMDVRRHQPPVDARGPGQTSAAAAAAYPVVIRRLFQRPETVITMENIDRTAMEADLDRIERRRLIYARDGA
jgi:hypothetical protein